ncbi:MAG: histidine kinase, partial [Pseudomonadota bacterium]
MNNRSMPPLGHPLELIPFFRRWPPSMRRNLLYTLIWSCGLGTLLTAVEIALLHDRRPLLGYLLPMLLISNLIGFMIHGGSMLASSLTDGRSSRMRGLPRLMFSICLVGSSVLLGLGLGNALLSGKNPFELLANRSVLLQSLVLAVAIALVMYWVRGSAEKRLERALDEARQKELMASTARLLAEARLRALQAQIEPHFLYNTLANVVSLIGPKPAQAQHMLERFIDYLRASLASSRSEEATLGTETRLVAAYLDVLAVRMGERLRYR